MISLLLFRIVLTGGPKLFKKEGKIKDIQLGRKEVKQVLFLDGCLRRQRKVSLKKLLELLSTERE